MILSDEVISFTNEMRVLRATGCLTVPENHLAELVNLLGKADQILSETPNINRVLFSTCRYPQEPKILQKPCLLVITEEDFLNKEWAKKIRSVASYFLNVTS